MLDLRKKIPFEEFDYNILLSALADYKNPRVKINDLIHKNLIVRVKKGIYVFGPKIAHKPYSPMLLSNMVYGPSYISLEYALSYYNLIPERVREVTCVTNKRNKIFNTPVGRFSYKYINPKLYLLSTVLNPMDTQRNVHMATKEKSLVEMLYFNHQRVSELGIKCYLFDDLRIDIESLKTIDIQKAARIAQMYRRGTENSVRKIQELI